MSILIENVSKKFGEKTILDNINLEIKTGSLVALLGSSGSGKSTLLRVVAGFEQPNTGRIWLHGKDSRNLSVQEKEIGFVFQAYALFQHLTVYENIAFGVSVNRPPFNFIYSIKSLISFFFYFKGYSKQNLSPVLEKPLKILDPLSNSNKIFKSNQQPIGETKGDIKNVEELLRVVQLDELAHRYPTQLSGGQCQRVALARALAAQPKVLLLDEPFGALDLKVRKQLRRWLRQLHEKVGVTTLFVTHDHQEAMEVANEIVVLDKGRVKHSLQSPQTIYNRLNHF